jgi:hypothetical protein
MNHQISLPNDTYFMIAYLAAVIVLIGVLLFAVEVKDLARKRAKL